MNGDVGAETATAAGPQPRRGAVVFIFITLLLDMLALGIIVPILPKLIEGFVSNDTANAARIFGLFGIDAPERRQSCGPLACGTTATEALADILSAGPVRCTRVNTDRYARTVARCKAGRVDVNREMVRRGMAWAYRQYSEDYVPAEKAAKKARVGIWKHRSQPAWEYRRETR